jgi:nitroimidazol reductase NimA-like FMN-containing flavoprotein (pyridoxamine 5'-phosphate oxidase superfamily)
MAEPSRLTPIHGMEGAKLWAYLARQKTIRVATANEKGSIYLSPLWYVVIDQRIFLPLDAGSRHAKNSEAGRALSAVVDSGDEYATVHGVRVTGKLKAVEEEALVGQVIERIFEKYFYEGHPYAESYFQFGRAAGRRILELAIDKVFGWDMRETSLPTVPEARTLPAFVQDRRLP